MSEEEIRRECLSYLNEIDTYKREYPSSKKSSVDEFYVDQSQFYCRIYDRNLRSSYTSFGIKEIESWFSRQILNGNEFSKAKLEKMIRRNPHLHNIIKTNLLSNLRRRWIKRDTGKK